MLQRARLTKLRSDDHPVLNVLAMAAAYSPRAGEPLGLELPFDPVTARLRDEVWARWLEHDPVRFVPCSIAAFRRLRLGLSRLRHPGRVPPALGRPHGGGDAPGRRRGRQRGWRRRQGKPEGSTTTSRRRGRRPGAGA